MNRNFIILGGGSVTAEYYLPALSVLGFAGRATVVDPDERSLSSLRSAFPDVKLVGQDHHTALSTLPDEGGERIVIALPNHLHVEAVRAALTRRRNVLCEKPLALRAADCTTLRELALANQCELKVAMSRRYLPSLMLARQMVLAEELGAIRSIDVCDCAPFPWRPKSLAFFAPGAGGVLADMGVHYLDYLETVVGEMRPLSYTDDSRGGNEASLSYTLRAGDIPVNMRLSRLDQGGTFVRIACEHGIILIEKKDECGVLVSPAGKPARRVALEQPFPDPAWPKNFHGSFCAMLHDLQGKQTNTADVADAERTAALIEWAYNTRTGQSPALRRSPAPPVPDVLVTGATGFIGGHLIDRLAEAGQATRVAVRSPATCANIARYPLEIAPVSLLKPDEVAKSLSGIRRIFHLAYGREGRDAGSVTIQGTRNLVEAGIAAGVESIVILSTMYVFGFPPTASPVDESFPYHPYGGTYGQSKARMERWCLERAKTSAKTRIVVLNPTCVFGPRGVAYTQLPVDLARQGQFCWLDGGKGLCNFTYVDSVVDAMLVASNTEPAHGQRFIINDGTMPWRDFLAPLVAPLGKDIPDYSVEAFKSLPRSGPPFRFRDLVSAALGASEVRSVAKRSALVRKYAVPLANGRFSRRPAPVAFERQEPVKTLPPDWLLDLYGPTASVFSAEKARQVLKWSPSVSYEAARDKTVQWLAAAGYYAPYTS